MHNLGWARIRLCLAVGLAAWTAVPAGTVRAQSRPNILLVIADDLNTRIGPYADPALALHTPNLDRLAARGVTFTRAYSQFPVCGPSRASLLSGLYPERNGVVSNAFENANHRTATPALADHPTLPGFFRRQGYFTARVSKIFHMGVPGGIERGEVGGDDPDSWDFAVNIMAPETLSAGTLETLSTGRHYGSNFARMILPDGQERTQADVLAAAQAIAILETRAGARPAGATNRSRLKADAPFFLAVGFVRPHVPLIAPARHFARYPDNQAVLAEAPPGDLDDVPAPARGGANAERFGMSPDQQRQAIAAYHASISFMDEQFGRVLDALDRLQLADSTIVVFVSDHGFNLGEHESWQKLHLWEESVRVPLIVSAPGVTRPNTRTDAIAELIDLYPTMVALGGLRPQAPSILQGRDLTPWLRTPAQPGPDRAAYTITDRNGASVRTDRWRYTRWGATPTSDNEELYDHETDPLEYRNLARLREHDDVLLHMRAILDEARRTAPGR